MGKRNMFMTNMTVYEFIANAQNKCVTIYRIDRKVNANSWWSKLAYSCVDTTTFENVTETSRRILRIVVSPV